MAAWLPFIKTAFPIIAEVVMVARPIFTKKSNDALSEELITRQIEELQSAATQNADSLKALAAQVQTTLEGLEAAATELQKKLERAQKLAGLALSVGLIGFALSLYQLSFH